MNPPTPVGPRRVLGLLALGVLSAVACARAPVAESPVPERPAAPTAPPPAQPPTPEPSAPSPRAPTPGALLGQSDDFVIVAASAGDTLRSLAERYLGDGSRGWMIADFNRIRAVTPGQEIVIPLRPQNPRGVWTDGYQTVPVLCYHRFGNEMARMVVSGEAFADQMRYLADHGYRVIALSALLEFLEGRASVPERAVVITIDDGYRSSYEVAFPVLKRHGFPATIFVYTDFVGARAGLTWAQMREMTDSGLISIQAHSKAHSNLALPAAGEDDHRYRERVAREVRAPTETIHHQLGVPLVAFAYPYGDANDLVIEQVREQGYRMAATVQAGGNPFFAYPFMLRRTMVYAEDDLASFGRKLEVFQSLSLK